MLISTLSGVNKCHITSITDKYTRRPQQVQRITD